MKRQKYTPEFRAEATKLVTEQGLSQEAAAIRLGASGDAPGLRGTPLKSCATWI